MVKGFAYLLFGKCWGDIANKPFRLVFRHVYQKLVLSFNTMGSFVDCSVVLRLKALMHGIFIGATENTSTFHFTLIGQACYNER